MEKPKKAQPTQAHVQHMRISESSLVSVWVCVKIVQPKNIEYEKLADKEKCFPMKFSLSMETVVHKSDGTGSC
jgi:hypothetical protein